MLRKSTQIYYKLFKTVTANVMR